MRFSRKPVPSARQNILEGGGANGSSIFCLGELEQQRLTWEHLETIRLKRLHIPNRYSRHLGREFIMPREKYPLQGPNWTNYLKKTPETGVPFEKKETGKKKTATSSGNSLAPFYTMAKPTCGYFFSCSTDNKRRQLGIPPSDLVKWRTFSQ